MPRRTEPADFVNIVSRSLLLLGDGEVDGKLTVGNGLLVSSPSITNLLNVDASSDAIGIGSAPSGSAFVEINRPAKTASSNYRLFRVQRHDLTYDTNPTNSYHAEIDEPTLHATAPLTISKAATLYIRDAPQAGTNITITKAYALLIDNGWLSPYGGIVMDAAKSGIYLGAPQDPNSSLVVDRFAGTGARSSAFTYVNFLCSGFQLTANIGLQTNVRIRQSTFTGDAPGRALTTAVAFYVEGAPVAGTNLTITNSYAIWVDGGLTRLDGELRVGDDAAPGAGETALLLMVNDGAATSMRRVSVGAADSGGTGYRVLRVPN